MGISTWAQNLLEPANSLYNEACCISALKTFRELSVGVTYQFMNINLQYVNDFDLLEKAYDHDVHFYMEGIFCKEQKQTIKHRFDNQRKALQESHMRFSISQYFPKRYIRIVKPIQAHRNEEYSQEKEVYIARELPFRSGSANRFMRNIDKIIKKTYHEEGRRDQHCHQIHIKNPPTTDFPKAPKGFPIDFYDVFSPEQDSEDESIGDNDMDYGKSIILESSYEYESNNDSENTQYNSKPAKDRKGKQKANEEDFEADNMELDEEYGRAKLAGGLTEEEWNAWQ
ncbi:hypothetical protein O181_014249 [Austropuccinia psidii MF-1]|uniref:Uncharacterized protein n=1 Tax=Austropuccinia psidii MF-1 TaxID=1389203 RepID=A0A9Q3GPN7_9BASI|nr:hypothetical protein [Austropuccinia psidii MF-1]